MILADRPGLHRLGQHRQFGFQRRAGQLAARADPLRQLHPALDLAGRNAQPRGQTLRQHRRGTGLIGRISHLSEHPIHQPAVGALLSLQPLSHLHPERVTHLI